MRRSRLNFALAAPRKNPFLPEQSSRIALDGAKPRLHTAVFSLAVNDPLRATGAAA